MSKVRVYEVAKQLNMDQKTLVALFQSMGIGDVRNHMSAVESDVVERVKRHLERQKAPQGPDERVRSDGRVVKRQRRPADEVPAARPSAPGAVEARGVPSPSPSQVGVRSAGLHEVPEAPASAPVRRRPPAAEPSAPAPVAHREAAPSTPEPVPAEASPAPEPVAREQVAVREAAPSH